MNGTTIFTTVIPMVVAILTIYFNNFFSERSKRQEYFRNKKHEHIPHIYKEMRLIYIKFSNGVSLGDGKTLLPPQTTDIQQVNEFLEKQGLSTQEIAAIEKLWNEDYEKAWRYFDARIAEKNVEIVEKRVQELHEYWLIVELYIKPSLNNSIAKIHHLFNECIYHEYMLIWLRSDINGSDFRDHFDMLQNRGKELNDRIHKFYTTSRKSLKRK